MSDKWMEHLHEVIAAHEATNAKLLLRVAELEMSQAVAATSLKTELEYVAALREQVARLSAPAAGLAESGPYTLADVALIEANRGRPYGRLRETVVERDALREQVATLKLELRATEAAFDESQCDLGETLEKLDAAKAELATLQQTRVIEERETKAMVDAAKADAARLRETANTFLELLKMEWEPTSDAGVDARVGLVVAVSVMNDSAAWLESKIAERTAPLLKALNKINTIRNSIVGMQGFHFSEHAYPLVAALDEIGIKGDGYELSRKNLGTLIEQIKAAEMTIELHVEREKSLEQQLVAATNDSDERLREVMVDVTLAGVSCGESRGAAGIFDKASRDTDVAFIVDKKLRGGA